MQAGTTTTTLLAVGKVRLGACLHDKIVQQMSYISLRLFSLTERSTFLPFETRDVFQNCSSILGIDRTKPSTKFLRLSTSHVSLVGGHSWSAAGAVLSRFLSGGVCGFNTPLRTPQTAQFSDGRLRRVLLHEEKHACVSFAPAKTADTRRYQGFCS